MYLQYYQNWMCQKWDLNSVCKDLVEKEALKVWWTRLWMANYSDIWMAQFLVSQLSLRQLAGSVSPAATDVFHTYPDSAERALFLWMWLGSGSSNGWKCSITGISGCHGVSRRFEGCVVGWTMCKGGGGAMLMESPGN